MSSKVVTLILTLLLVFLQSQLWLGKSDVFTAQELMAETAQYRTANAALSIENQRLSAKINNLQTDLQNVELMARQQLQMVKPNELFVEINE